MNLVTETVKKFTLAQYLNDANKTDSSCELVNGELVEMPPESWKNSAIARELLIQFLQFISIQNLCHKDTEILVSSSTATARLPDLMVLSDEGVKTLKATNRGTITLEMPPPLLVVEVVSPGKANEDQDYRYKRSEYAARGVAEYWIVDPIQQKILVLTLVDGLYEEATFQSSDRLQSSTFPEFALTATQILQIEIGND